MAITASAVIPSNSLEEFRIEFNNLVTDVDGIETGAVVTATTTTSGKSELATTAETITGTDTARVITPAGLHAALAGLTDTTIVAADSIIFADANDSNALKEDTVQGILDLAALDSDTTPQLGGFLDANSKFISHSQGAAIASVAGDTNIWTNFDGNTVHITGTNAITDFGTPKSAGDSMWVIFDAAASVVDSATITVAGNTNYQAAANDLALVYALTTSTFLFMPFPNSGGSPVAAVGGGGWLGESGAPNGDSSDIIRINEQTLNNSVSMAATDNGSCAGPLSVASGVTLTISSGATFTVI